MTTVYFYEQVDMLGGKTTWGTVTNLTNSNLSGSDGYKSVSYNGNFSFPAHPTSYTQITGTFNSYQEYSGNQLVINAVGANTDIHQTLAYLAAGQVNAAIALSLKGGDSIYGSSYSDNLVGFGTNSYFQGNGGNDTITGSIGGINVAGYSGTAAEYQILRQGSTVTIADMVQFRDGNDALSNINQVKFNDYTLVLDKKAAIDATVYELYQAAFARTPDNGGFRYWTDAAEKQGLSALQLADNFTHSQEFLQKFGQNPTNLDYVTKLYINVLGRAPDKGGLDYWVHQADAGRSHDQLLVDFATSSENVQLTGIHTANNVYWTT